MKKIKIFLASSIVELARERDELELFIRNVSDKFEDNYDTKIIPLRCENVDTCMTLDGKQEEFNQLIRESEMCFFIFFTRVGSVTRQEFEVAFERFRTSENRKPQIYVYFKTIPEGVTADASVREFMDTIDRTYKHYYSNFSNIDTIKLRILLNLKMQEMDFVKVEIKGDKCLVDNADVLSINNVSEFANSKELSALTSELQSVEERYVQMKPIYQQGGFGEEFRREYVRLTARRQHLKEMIISLKQSIFELSLNLSRDEVRGELTPRQREAYRLLELGDSKGCLSVLDSDDIDDEFERFERRCTCGSTSWQSTFCRPCTIIPRALRKSTNALKRSSQPLLNTRWNYPFCTITPFTTTLKTNMSRRLTSRKNTVRSARTRPTV